MPCHAIHALGLACATSPRLAGAGAAGGAHSMMAWHAMPPDSQSPVQFTTICSCTYAASYMYLAIRIAVWAIAYAAIYIFI